MLNPISLGEKSSPSLISTTQPVSQNKSITLLHSNSSLKAAANNITLIIVGVISAVAILYALIRYLLSSIWGRPDYPKAMFLHSSLPQELVLLRQNAQFHDKVESINKRHGLTLNPYSLYPSFSMNNERQLEVKDSQGFSWRFPLKEPEDNALIDLHTAYFSRHDGDAKARTVKHPTPAIDSAALRRENLALRASLDEATVSLKDARSRIGDTPLQRRLDELMRLNTKLQRDLEKLQRDNDALQRRVEQAEQETGRLSQERDALQEALTSTEGRLTDLQAKNEQLKKELDEARALVETLTKRLQERDADNNRLSSRVRLLVNTIKRKDGENQALLDELARAREELEKSNTERDAIAAERDRCLDVIRDHEETIRTQNEEIGELTSANKSKARHIHLLQQQILRLRRELSAKDARHDADVEAIERLEQDAEATRALQTENDALKEELQKTNQKSDPSLDGEGEAGVPDSSPSEGDLDVDGGDNRIHALEAELEDERTHRQHAEARNHELEKRATDAEADAQAKQRTIDERNDELRRLKESEAQAKQKASELEDQLAAEKAARKRVEADAQNKQNRIDELEAQNQTLAKERDKLRDSEREAQAARQRAEDLNTTLEQRAKAAEKDAQNKQKRIDELETANNDLQQQLNSSGAGKVKGQDQAVQTSPTDDDDSEVNDGDALAALQAKYNTLLEALNSVRKMHAELKSANAQMFREKAEHLAEIDKLSRELAALRNPPTPKAVVKIVDPEPTTKPKKEAPKVPEDEDEEDDAEKPKFVKVSREAQKQWLGRIVDLEGQVKAAAKKNEQLQEQLRALEEKDKKRQDEFEEHEHQLAEAGRRRGEDTQQIDRLSFDREQFDTLQADNERLLKELAAVRHQNSLFRQQFSRVDSILPSTDEILERRSPDRDSADKDKATRPGKKRSPRLATDSLSMGSKVSAILAASNEQLQEREAAFDEERRKWKKADAAYRAEIDALKEKVAKLSHVEREVTQEREKEKELQAAFNADALETVSSLSVELDKRKIKTGERPAPPLHRRTRTLTGKDKKPTEDAIDLAFDNEQLRRKLKDTESSLEIFRQSANAVYADYESQLAKLKAQNEELLDALSQRLQQAGLQVSADGTVSALSSSASPSMTELPAASGDGDGS